MPIKMNHYTTEQSTPADLHAVRDLSFRVRKGELFAFLGLNGAGKSTTIHIM